MPVIVRPSAKQRTASRKNRISRKRRENQNVEITELASFIPLSSSFVPGQGSSNSLVPATSGGNKLTTLPVLRLTTSFLKLQNFVTATSYVKNSCGEHVSTENVLRRVEEAIDGFLIILDKEANIIYASRTIAGYVGLIQQDVIGQNLIDITHPEFSSEIQDSLKPAVMLPTTVDEDRIISQYRQFRVRFNPSVAYSTSPSHTLVQVCGNLKVKLSPVKSCADGVMEFVEPSAVGFIGECRVVESVPSILEISVPCSSFVITRSLDMKKIISVDASVKEVFGYDPELALDASFNGDDFFHPTDVNMISTMKRCMMQSRHNMVVSPFFRFLASSGDWIWIQLEGRLRYCNKKGISVPQCWEVKVRALGQWSSRLKCIEQKELYTSESNHILSSSNKDPDITPDRLNLVAKCSNDQGTRTTRRMIDSIESTRLPDTVLEPDQQFAHIMPHVNPTAVCGPMVDSYDPVASMDLSLLSPDTGTTLDSAMSTDSIPSASPVLFSSSHTPDFNSQSTENVFNPQIPPNFNFSCNMPYTNHSPNLEQSTSTYFLPNSTIDISMSQGQMPSSLYPQMNLSNAPLVQPMFENVMMENSVAAVPDCSSNMDAFFSQGDQTHVSMQNNFFSSGPELVGQPHANNDGLSKLLSDSQTNVNNSNCELEDILQQFM